MGKFLLIIKTKIFYFNYFFKYIDKVKFIIIALILISCSKPTGPKQSFGDSEYLTQYLETGLEWKLFNKKSRLNEYSLIISGYSSCQWCQHLKTNTLNNDLVKNKLNSFNLYLVDKDTQFGIDQSLQQISTEKFNVSGWPLVLILKDQKPIFASNYIEASDFLKILSNVSYLSTVKNNKREELLPVDIKKEFLQNYDPLFKGFSTKYKHPQPLWAFFMMELLYKEESNLLLLEKTFETIINSPLKDIDQLFFRYSHDKTWNKPHFEKLALDNLLIVKTLLQLSKRTKNPIFKAQAKKTLIALEENLSQDGLMGVSIDADHLFYTEELLEKNNFITKFPNSLALQIDNRFLLIPKEETALLYLQQLRKNKVFPKKNTTKTLLVNSILLQIYYQIGEDQKALSLFKKLSSLYPSASNYEKAWFLSILTFLSKESHTYLDFFSNEFPKLKLTSTQFTATKDNDLPALNSLIKYLKMSLWWIQDKELFLKNNKPNQATSLSEYYFDHINKNRIEVFIVSKIPSYDLLKDAPSQEHINYILIDSNTRIEYYQEKRLVHPHQSIYICNTKKCLLPFDDYSLISKKINSLTSQPF